MSNHFMIDYWKSYNELLDLLKEDNQDLIVEELQKARLYVNGLTDGWHDFKSAFEKCLKENRSKMNVAQIELAESLLMELNHTLRGR